MGFVHTFSLAGFDAVMGKITGILMLLLLVVLVGGSVFLATWDMPPPTAKVEKVIPDERFKH